jgi:hypothetical protein
MGDWELYWPTRPIQFPTIQKEKIVMKASAIHYLTAAVLLLQGLSHYVGNLEPGVIDPSTPRAILFWAGSFLAAMYLAWGLTAPYLDIRAKFIGMVIVFVSMVLDLAGIQAWGSTPFRMIVFFGAILALGVFWVMSTGLRFGEHTPLGRTVSRQPTTALGDVMANIVNFESRPVGGIIFTVVNAAALLTWVFQRNTAMGSVAWVVFWILTPFVTLRLFKHAVSGFPTRSTWILRLILILVDLGLTLYVYRITGYQIVLWTSFVVILTGLIHLLRAGKVIDTD